MTVACGGDHNVMAPDGPAAARITRLGWFMIIAATAIGVLFLGLLAAALWRNGRPAHDGHERRLIVAGGVVLPVAVIAVLTVLSLNVLNDENVLNDDAGATSVAIEVVGHRYWWEVSYPDAGFTTANEFVIPVGQKVAITLRSDDVNHSFWVPDLAGKMDLIPGHTNHLVIEADRAGRYRGQCAEFCGVQHAQMAFFITAVSAADYQRWLVSEAAPASPPANAEEQQGLDAFLALPCASCHEIRGTAAAGHLGPDLTHLANRQTLAAGAIANIPGNLGGWISDAQTIKAGNEMPPVPMSPDQLRAILAYLDGAS